MYALIIANQLDTDMVIDAEAFGPFGTVGEAQDAAEQWRSQHGLPIEATPDNNDIWTDLGWIFAIKPLGMIYGRIGR